MFKIDIHTHILPDNLNTVTGNFQESRFLKINSLNEESAMLEKDGKNFRKISCNCWSPAARISECQDTGVDRQVLSTIPALFSYWAKPEETLELARFLNDHIAEVIAENPGRFYGLGTVPMQAPNLAIKEMERCRNELGLQGIQIGSNVNNRNLSDAEFFPWFEAAVETGCALFIHPWDMMGQEQMEKYWLPWLVGMPAETSRAVCSLIFGGVFERLPNLRVAFAHGGGTFPFTLGRIDHGYRVRPDLCAVDTHTAPSAFKGKFYLDSLVHDKNALKYLVENFGAESIAMGSDYPFPLGESQPGSLIESINEFSESTKKRLLSGTALEWLGVEKDW